jgi:hypothetical protein
VLNKAPADDDQEDVDEAAPSGSSSGVDDFEVLERVKSTAVNGNGKANKKNKRAGRGR